MQFVLLRPIKASRPELHRHMQYGSNVEMQSVQHAKFADWTQTAKAFAASSRWRCFICSAG
eukprot:6193074-Pleurochrysis_carterae.AAC.10